MLTITIGDEFFDERLDEFVLKVDVTLHLEHSLAALSKWESKHEKAFLGKSEKSQEEIIDYIYCMILDDDIAPEILDRLTNDDFEKINTYLNSKQSATSFFEQPARRGPSETITSELIYYWMASLQIPFEAQYWHLNRLFALIKIFNLKNGKEQKMSRSEIAARNRALNEQRKKQLGTSG